MKKENKVMTSFMIEKEMLARLTEEARNDGRSRSQFLRRMVEMYLEGRTADRESMIAATA